MRVAALLLALGCSTAAQAQIPPEYADGRTPQALVKAAFDTKYGRLMVREFGRALRLNVEEECSKRKNLIPAAMEKTGHDLLVRHGARMLELTFALIDPAKLDTAMKSRAGEGVRAELAKLKSDPEVRRFMQLNEPIKLARLADRVADTVDRNATLAGLRWRVPISPNAKGNEKMKQANPEERAMEEIDRFIDKSKSKTLKRWLELQGMLEDSFREAADRGEMERRGPRQTMPELAGELSDLCIPPVR